VIDVLEGYTSFPREAFEKHVETFYPLAVGLMEKEMGADIRSALCGIFRRVGELKFGMSDLTRRDRGESVGSRGGRDSRNGSISATPTSPARTFELSRRHTSGSSAHRS
jgi:hypothetical protein